jgi:hydrogenase maturation protein HypF
VRGQVQGVGFRPFIYRVATELGLAGWVRNGPQGVEIEVQGCARRVGGLLARLRAEAPPLARVEQVDFEPRAAASALHGFAILESLDGRADTAVAPDTAVCDDCLRELFDTADRRYRYPFINCTNCGPRYTITRRLPYDRPHTSMAGFAQCADCRHEYHAPASRRFHAQPNACAACGPTITLLDADGRAAGGGQDPVAETVTRLARGEIVAIKGLGGFHLACDARNGDAVARLRARKQREEKPFAVMVAGLASAELWAAVRDEERAALASAERPIVLLRKRECCDRALDGVAPGVTWLGVMLPYTPLQYLLFHEAAGRPQGTAWLNAPQPLALVMTSANPGGEPLVTGNDEALERLHGIADASLLHDRDIVSRCDDSVVRVAEIPLPPPFRKGGNNGNSWAQSPDSDRAPALGVPPFEKGGPGWISFIRRARGYTPRAIRLAHAGPSVLAVGGYFKNTFCITRGAEAFLSPHVGELDNAATCAALTDSVSHMLDVLDIEPECVAHDLHPDFFSSRFAFDFAARRKLRVVAVQHHHAHAAAVMAEHGLEGAVLALTLDGVGLGADAGLWGGELLRVDGAQCERLGHLRELGLPGGDRAAREPWRMAASVLHALGRDEEIETRFAAPAGRAVRELLARGVNAPPTSSAGRWFDAAAGLLGVKPVMAFEGQAAMLLEGLAARQGAVEPLPKTESWVRADGTLDLLPLAERLAAERDAAHGAALFHATLAAALAHWVAQAAHAQQLRRVVLGGGCFLNQVLSDALRMRLRTAGLEVYEARQAPPNDGGLALGQAWVAIKT